MNISSTKIAWTGETGGEPNEGGRSAGVQTTTEMAMYFPKEFLCFFQLEAMALRAPMHKVDGTFRRRRGDQLAGGSEEKCGSETATSARASLEKSATTTATLRSSLTFPEPLVPPDDHWCNTLRRYRRILGQGTTSHEAVHGRRQENRKTYVGKPE